MASYLCDRLFALERAFIKLTASQRLSARMDRMDQSQSVMKDFFVWADATMGKTLPKSPLGRALRYALDQKQWLERVLLDGRLELSNNRAERSIKPFVIGRKNWLFNNTPRGANTSAMLYSIVETEKENNINSHDYLTAVFKHAPNLALGECVDGLLPWNWKEDV